MLIIKHYKSEILDSIRRHLSCLQDSLRFLNANIVSWYLLYKNKYPYLIKMYTYVNVSFYFESKCIVLLNVDCKALQFASKIPDCRRQKGIQIL